MTLMRAAEIELNNSYKYFIVTSDKYKNDGSRSYVIENLYFFTIPTIEGKNTDLEWFFPKFPALRVGKWDN